jgi:hypothetical protein
MLKYTSTADICQEASCYQTFSQQLVGPEPQVQWERRSSRSATCAGAQHFCSRGETLHALLCLLLPDAPGSFGFRRRRAYGSISRSLRCGVCGFGRSLDLRFNGCSGLVWGFLLSAPFWWSDGRCHASIGLDHASRFCGFWWSHLGLFARAGLFDWWR